MENVNSSHSEASYYSTSIPQKLSCKAAVHNLPILKLPNTIKYIRNETLRKFDLLRDATNYFITKIQFSCHLRPIQIPVRYLKM